MHHLPPGLREDFVKKDKKVECVPNLSNKIKAALRETILKDSCHKIEVKCGLAKIRKKK